MRVDWERIDAANNNNMWGDDDISLVKVSLLQSKVSIRTRTLKSDHMFNKLWQELCCLYWQQKLAQSGFPIFSAAQATSSRSSKSLFAWQYSSTDIFSMHHAFGGTKNHNMVRCQGDITLAKQANLRIQVHLTEDHNFLPCFMFCSSCLYTRKTRWHVQYHGIFPA